MSWRSVAPADRDGDVGFWAPLAVSACGLPRSGPTRARSSRVPSKGWGGTHIVSVDDRVNRAASHSPAYGFGSGFPQRQRGRADVVRPGDVLGLSIWENVDDGLLAAMGSSSTQLTQLQVDSQGYIFVPYAGRVKASATARTSCAASSPKTLQPDPGPAGHWVTRVAGDGATVSVMGKVNAQGVYPIERPTRTLSSMLSKSGGVSIEPEVAGGHRQARQFQRQGLAARSLSNTRNDIALRPGDVILVEEDQRSFTALGARVADRSAAGQRADQRHRGRGHGRRSLDAARRPQGVFVLREEPQSVAWPCWAAATSMATSVSPMCWT